MMSKINLTTKQAQAIMDAHEISAMLQDDEERELLEVSNPELYEAYQALEKIADGEGGCPKFGSNVNLCKEPDCIKCPDL